MNVRELKDLITDGESERLEFKRSTGQRTEAAKARPEPATQSPTQPGDLVGAHDEAHGEETIRENGTKLALSRHQVAILRKSQSDRTLLELMAVAGRSDRTKFRHQVLNPLLEVGLIEMTIPDKPRSSKQMYRLTQKGLEFLGGFEGKKE